MNGDFALAVIAVLQALILAYFLLVNGMLTLLFSSAIVEMRAHRLGVWGEHPWRLLSSEVIPAITIIAPAHNEEMTIEESVRSLLTLSYPNLEVVIINDGSTDATVDVLRDRFDLVAIHAAPIRRRLDSAPIRGVMRSRRTPSLVVVDKENGGKADALNVGLDVASGELVCAIDSDTIVERDALLRMVRPFLLDPGAVAVGGTIRAVNGCEVRHGRVVAERAPRSYLPLLQAMEYLRAFLAGRLGWNRLGGNLVISGAFGLFRREEMIAAGGYLHETVGEDMEVVVRMRRAAKAAGRPGRAPFVPDPVAWTEVPARIRVLARQRDRWHRGLADVLRRHGRMILNPREGVMGMVAAPYFVFVELLAPVVELLGLVVTVAGLATGAIDVEFAVLFLLVAYGWGIALSAGAVALEEWTYRGYGSVGDRLLLLCGAVIESVGYRQATAVWRLHGLWRFARGRRDWGVMTREGFSDATLRS